MAGFDYLNLKIPLIYFDIGYFDIYEKLKFRPQLS